MVRLDIFSDPVCPWCALGFANLTRALESRPQHALHLAWHPFQLDPDLPRAGMDRAAWLRARFPDPAAIEASHARLNQLGREAGLAFAWERITRMPNTLDAHRLIHWAGIEGRQTPMAAALFRGYWQQGRDIGDPDALAALAGEAGLDAKVVARLLASDADVADIRARAGGARSRGVRGVPTFLIGGEHALSGAQPVALWQQLIDALATAPPSEAP